MNVTNIPLYLRGKKFKNEIKVVLQGDGGDVLFADYKRYQTLAARKYWCPFVGLGGVLHKLLTRSGDNEIGYFDIATQSGMLLGIVYLFVLLKYAKHYRIFVLLILFHQQYFYSPLILHVIKSYSREISYHRAHGVKNMRSIKSILDANLTNK